MARARVPKEDGFTLVEVMVAITLLLVGVLGTVTMIDGANAVTTQTKAREGATALARSVLEISRGVQYRELTGAQVLAEIEARPGLADADPVTPGHQIESRNFAYTLTPSVCSMDDAKDSLGDHDEPTVTFCSDSDGPGSGDRNPDDYRRVTVRVDWALQGGRTESLTQRGLVTNPVGGLGPSVNSLDPKTPDTAVITGALTTSASYDVTTSTVAETVSWSVNGSRLGEATGADTSWSFTWGLGAATDPHAVADCTYVLQAEAFDEKGRAGTPNALTVTLNRRWPLAPHGFEGGANLRGDDVDLQWNPGRDCDIERYRVYVGVDGGPVDTLVAGCDVAAQITECVDTSPPAGALAYEVVAVDRDANGVQQEGDRSLVQVTVPDPQTNQAPPTPDPVAICVGAGDETCVDIHGNPAPDGTVVLSWDPVVDGDGDSIRFYRVYRDGTDYAHRFDVLFPVFDATGAPVTPLRFVDAKITGAHEYFVTAVDEHFGESAPQAIGASYTP